MNLAAEFGTKLIEIGTWELRVHTLALILLACLILIIWGINDGGSE